MTCFKPLRATLLPGKRVVMGGDPKGTGRPLSLPCNKCIGCKMERARMWSVRICHEASLYDGNWFVTLDYAPESLVSPSLEYRDFQLFMKRLRKEWRGIHASPNGKHPIRFFVAGEYGAQYQRPHWHVILFNVDIPDKVKFCNETFRSSTLERLWGKGHAVIGSVTPRSAAYVAGYTLFKKGHAAEYEDMVDVSTGEVMSRRQEFVRMSTDPGVGFWWYEKFKADLFPGDRAVMSEGGIYKVPRFYMSKFELSNPADAEEVKYERYLRALEHVDDGTPERLAVREEVARRKMDTFTKREH